jgi:hypothetical protein
MASPLSSRYRGRALCVLTQPAAKIRAFVDACGTLAGSAFVAI